MRTKEQVFAEIEKKASVHQAHGITKAEAICKVAEASPELYREYCSAPVGTVESEPRPRETVAQFVCKQLNKEAVEIQKTRGLSASDAFTVAMEENPQLVEASRRFPKKFMDEIGHPRTLAAQKSTVQKVVRA